MEAFVVHIFIDTVQIAPFLIYCEHDSRRDDSQLRGTTQRRSDATGGSERALARDRRALAAGAGTHRRVGKAENASTRLREGQQEEAPSSREEAAQKARGAVQSSTS